jgi:hypothetical protein
VEGVVSASDLTPEQNLWGLFLIPDDVVFASQKVLHHGQGLILSNLISAEKFSHRYLPLNFGQIFSEKQLRYMY